MNEMNLRIKEIISSKGLNVSKLAESIGMPQVTVNNYMLGKRKISFEFISAILATYPDISAEWLLRGHGEMLISMRPEGNMVTEDIDKDFYAGLEELRRRVDDMERQVKENRQAI